MAPAEIALRSGQPGTRGAVALVSAGIVLLAVNLRAAVTAMPPLVDRLDDRLGLTPAVLGVVGALPPLAFSAAGVLGVHLLRRFSAERLAVVVLLMTAVGEVARPYATGVTGFVALTAVALVGMGLGNVVLPPLVKAWFPGRIGAVTALYVTTLCVGTAVPALIAVPVADAVGWQAGLALWGLLAAACLPVWLVLARAPLTRPAPVSEGRRPGVHHSPISWGLALLFATSALNLYAMFAWLPARLVDAGLTETQAGLHLAVFAGVGIAPSLLLPPLLGRFGHAGWFVTACAACYLAGYAGLLLAPLHLTTVWTAIAGLGGGSFPVVLTLIGLRSATPATAGALAGFVQAVGYLGAAGGPVLFGLFHELSGGWAAPFGFLALTVGLMVLAGAICAAPRSVDDDLPDRVPGRENPVDPAATLTG